MAEITRDLNQKEGTNIPNPYLKTLPTITDIINKNRNTDLINGKLNFPKTSQSPVIEQESRITTPNLTSPASVDPAVVQSQNGPPYP